MNAVRRNVSSLFMSEVARRILGFFTVAYLARTLGVEGFGTVMIGLTVLTYVSLTGSAGLHVFGTRAVARGDAAIDPGAIVGARLLSTGAAVLVVALSAVLWIQPPPLAEVVLITSLSGILHALFLEWYFQGRERMGEVAVARTLSAAVYLLFVTATVHGVEDLSMAALAAVVGDLASTGYLLIRYRRSVGPLRLSVSSSLSLLRSAWPFGAGSVLAHLSANFPILAIGAFLGSGQAGAFASANKLVFFLLMADRILGAVLLPASVRLRNAATEHLTTALARALRWILLIGLPLGIGGTMVATPLIVLVFGSAYAVSGPIFGILVWYAVLTMMHTVYTSALVAADGERSYRNVMAVSAGVNVAAVSAGILTAGVIGAAFGLLLAEGVSLVLMYRAVRHVMPLPRPKGLGRIVTASMLLAVSLPFLGEMHVLARVAAGAGIYAAAAMLAGAVTPKDLRELVERTA